MKVARVLSVLLHPIFMPLAGTFILLTFGGWLVLMPPVAKTYIYVVIGIATLAIPAAIMPLLLYGRVISDLYLSRTEERRIPLLIMAFLYLATAFVLQKAQVPGVIGVFMNGSSLIVLACAILSWRWKISNHMAGLGGVAGMVLAISLHWMLNLGWLLAILFMIAGIAGYARLRMGHHTPAQVYYGYLLGFFINFLLMRLI